MPIPVISVSQMREWEGASWAAGRTEPEVIRRVGVIIAKRSLELTRPLDRILIVAGKGHNGEDAREALQHLQEREVHLLNVTDADGAMEDLDAHLAQRPALIIDGLFGIGINRLLSAPWEKLIERLNQAAVPILTVDVPSGLNAESGQPEGVAIRATITITLAAPKSGLLKASAIPFVGRLEVASEIGLVACPHKSELVWISPEDFTGFPPVRQVNAHKGKFGHLVIIAGSLGYHGAAVLAARGALRACPGLVTVLTPENVYLPVAAQLQTAMVNSWKRRREPSENCTAILFGPGLAADDLPEELKDEVCYFWTNSSLPVVADASALNWLPPGPCRASTLRVVTPHPGEAARMLQSSTSVIQDDRVAAVRRLSERFGNCLVVLKGHQTLVGRSSGEISVNSSGNPFLAQGGSGDVLAGYLSGLLAQPALQANPVLAIRYAVWQHGAAADQLVKRQASFSVDELLPGLGRA
ncbi:MAG: NAD(P)H-hydrate dehydratase [Verrucomicrobiota bacterium]